VPHKNVFGFPACKPLLPKLLRNLKRNFQWTFPRRSNSEGYDKSSQLPENFAAVNAQHALISNQHDAGYSTLDAWHGHLGRVFTGRMPVTRVDILPARFCNPAHKTQKVAFGSGVFDGLDTHAGFI